MFTGYADIFYCLDMLLSSCLFAIYASDFKAF